MTGAMIDALMNAACAGDGEAALVLHDALSERSDRYVNTVAEAENLAHRRGDVWIVAVQRAVNDLLFAALSPPNLIWKKPFEFGASSIRSPVGRPSARLLGALNRTTSVRPGHGLLRATFPIVLTYFTRTYT